MSDEQFLNYDEQIPSAIGVLAYGYVMYCKIMSMYYKTMWIK